MYLLLEFNLFCTSLSKHLCVTSGAGYLCDFNEIEILMERLVCRHNCPIDGLDRNGRTALYMAAENNDFQSLHSLIHLDGAMGIVNNNGFTPLYIAAIEGHLVCVTLILNWTTGKACINMGDSVGKSSAIFNS